jgi:signal transduction histidine kinase
MMFFVSWLIGYTLRQRKKAEAEAVERRRYEQARRQLALTRRDMALASRIHDSVTGNLAYLAISLERARHDALEDSGEVPDFAYMHEMTVETLREVRQVIDVLDGDNRQINADGQPLFSERIDSELAQGDQYLHTLGFHGESRLRVESTAEGTDTQVVDEVSALLRELVTNIALHGRTAPHEYTLDVHVSDVAVTVSQANAIAAQSSFPDKPASGKGLDFHRRIIEGWGGQLSTCAEEDTWVCHASIPRHIVTI